jgi:hypothetical protein
MLYGALHSLFCDKYKTHAVWAECKFLNVKPVSASRTQLALRG